MPRNNNTIPFPQHKTSGEIYQKSLDEQIEHIMHLPAPDRIKAIAESPNPEALVRRFPEQDFYITLKEVDLSDALVLVRNANPSQLKFLFDLEWWEKYLPEEEKAWEWLEFLRVNAPRQLLMWLSNVDVELLISLLKKWLVLEKVPDPDDIDFVEATDKLPPHTIDNIYYWNAKKGDKLPLLKTILATLFELDRKLYFQVMEGVIWGIQAELEEDAYRWRKGRLEDLAIPDFYDALEIYKDIEPGELYSKHFLNKKSTVIQRPDITPSIYPLVLLPGRNLLAKAVEQIEDLEVLNFLKIEFASLANKIIVADRLSLGDSESMRKAVEKVVSYVELGLEQGGIVSVREAVEFLKSYPLESVFRVGFTIVKRLKKRAQQLIEKGWISNWPHKTLILQAPYQSLLEALIPPDPQCLEITPEGGLLTKPFSTLEEILWTEGKLREIEFMGEIYHALNVDYNQIVQNLWPLGQPGEPTEIKIDDIIITAIANKEIRGEYSCLPIPRTEIPCALRSLGQSSEILAGKFVSEIQFSSDSAMQVIASYVEVVLDQFKENFSGIKDLETIDPRYLEGILVKK